MRWAGCSHLFHAGILVNPVSAGHARRWDVELYDLPYGKRLEQSLCYSESGFRVESTLNEPHWTD
jgi:hypothetical protein